MRIVAGVNNGISRRRGLERVGESGDRVFFSNLAARPLADAFQRRPLSVVGRTDRIT